MPRTASRLGSASRSKTAGASGSASAPERDWTRNVATARLKTRYLEEIRPVLMERFGYSSVMQAPRIEKITVNMGCGDAKQDSKVLDAASDQLATITGQHPNV